MNAWHFAWLVAWKVIAMYQLSAALFASKYQALDSQHQVRVKRLSELVVYE